MLRCETASCPKELPLLSREILSLGVAAWIAMGLGWIAMGLGEQGLGEQARNARQTKLPIQTNLSCLMPEA
jgi:hypothetical protein